MYEHPTLIRVRVAMEPLISREDAYRGFLFRCYLNPHNHYQV
jgi:hypothetical protein